MNKDQRRLFLCSLLLMLLAFQFFVAAASDDSSSIGDSTLPGSDGGTTFTSTSASASASASEEEEEEEEEGEYYDERTLLDNFGEAAKQYLTQRVIPPTDSQCKWDWRYVRCEPYCDCTFAPKRGDYHLGRSCRLEKKPDCDSSTTPRPDANPIQLVIQRFVQGTQRVIGEASKKTKNGYKKVQSSVCDKLPEMDCSMEGGIPMLAWQERALCRHKIPTCHPSSEPATTTTITTTTTDENAVDFDQDKAQEEDNLQNI